MKITKKISFSLGLAVWAFSACTPQEKVAETRVDAELFPSETASATLDALPFKVDLPNGWTVQEEALLYRLVFDEGASGTLQILKTPLPDGSVGCSEANGKKYCTVEVDGILYSLVLTDKSMGALRRAEAEAILASVRPD